jgi:hypothetical protein
MKEKIMLASDQKKATGATRQRRTAKPPEEPAVAAPAPAGKPKRKTLLARVMKTAKKILKPRGSPQTHRGAGDFAGRRPAGNAVRQRPRRKILARPHAAGAAF